MHRMFLFVSIVLSFLLSACSGAGSTSSTSESAASESTRLSSIEGLTADSTAGGTLFTSDCASCHGSNATSGSANKNLPSIATSNETAAIDQILNGGDGMSSFASLTDQQIADLLGYLKSL